MEQKKRNADLYAMIASGDAKAADQLIEGNLALVVNACDDFLKSRPEYEYIREDLVAEGNLALVACVRGMPGKQQNIRDINMFLWRTIVQALQSFIDRDSGLCVSDREMRARRQASRCRTVFGRAFWRRRGDMLYRRILDGDVWAAEQLYQELRPYLALVVQQCIRALPAKARFVGALERRADRSLYESIHNLTHPHFYLRRPLASLFGRVKTAIKKASFATWEEDAVKVALGDTEIADGRDGRPDTADICDAIGFCCKTDAERIVVRLLENGTPGFEIARRLGVSSAAVSRMRKEIEGRFNQVVSLGA